MAAMQKLKLYITCLLAWAFLILALPSDDHAYVDHGTCGNACCKMEYIFATSTKTAINRITAALNSDASYSPQTMNEYVAS